MKFTSLLLISLFVGISQASAKGGAIGGGDISIYPIMECQASSMDPTFPSNTQRVVVMGEADHNGMIIPDITLTVALLDGSGYGNTYLPTQTLPHDFDPADLKTFQYAQNSPNNENYMTATFSVTGTNGYLFSTGEAYFVEELQLANCEWVSNAQ